MFDQLGVGGHTFKVGGLEVERAPKNETVSRDS